MDTNLEKHNESVVLRSLYYAPISSSVTNLTELSIREIPGNLEGVQASIVKLLLGSPNLKSLSMSLSKTLVAQFLPYLTRDIDYAKFLHILTHQYVAGGGKPLPLQRLDLGYSVLVNWDSKKALQVDEAGDEDEDEDENSPVMFFNLVDYACLEEVSIHNDCETIRSFDLYGRPCIRYDTFTPEVCPNLHTVRLYKNSQRAIDWIELLPEGYLNSIHINASRSRETSSYWRAIGKGNITRTSTLSTLDLDEEFIYLNERDPKTNGHFNLSTLRNIQALAVSCSSFPGKMKQALHDWLRGWESLEHFWLRLLPAHPGYTYFEVDCRDFARGIAVQNPKLRYVKVGNYAWRVWRNRRSGEEGVWLERLDRFEEGSIGLFTRYSF